MSASGGGGMEFMSMFMSSFGSSTKANLEKKVGQSQKALHKYNAQIAEIKAEDSIVRGQEAETRHRTAGRGMIGASRAAFAAAGVDVNDADSTAVNVQADIAALSEVDALTIRANAAREAWGFRAQAKDLRYRGEVAGMEGDQKSIGTLTSSLGSSLFQRYGFGFKGGSSDGGKVMDGGYYGGSV